MIAYAADYQPIDKRPVRFTVAPNPLSLQKRGLVHWFPLGKIDSFHNIISDRRFRPAGLRSVASPPSWFYDVHRGIPGIVHSAAGSGLPSFSVAPLAAPLTVTFWAKRYSFVTDGIEVWIGPASAPAWVSFYTVLGVGSFVIGHADNPVFASATVTLPIAADTWHFCAGVYVSNSERWAYCNGVASARHDGGVADSG